MGPTNGSVVPFFSWWVCVTLRWNSTLESIWCGVPVAAWPLYAEQQLNAFKLVVELGLIVEIKIDYRSNMIPGGGNEVIVTSKEIESGIRKLMNDEVEDKSERDEGED